MKFLKQGLSLALLGAGLAAVPSAVSTGASATPAAQPGPSVAQRMQSDARGSITTSTESATGRLSFARAGTDGDLLADVAATDRQGAVAKATSYLDTYAPAFGASKGQLVKSSVAADDLGWTVDFAQTYQGIPVFGALVRAHVDRDGDLTAVNGFAAPDIDVDTTPRVSATQAAANAVTLVRTDPADGSNGAAVDTSGLKATATDLVIYRTGAIKGDEGTNTLAYVTEVTNDANIRDKVFFDARSGKLLNRYSMVDDALDRELREAAGTAAAPTFTTVWKEGDPFPGNLNEDQQNLVNSSAESYWFFKNAFNRDSYDGNGAKRITVNNDPRINCPNANWNGKTTNYCDGVTSDDVVAHEWGHAYTEYTWGGIYQWQSGALNEGYSDIWGETTDLINGREDEGEGDLNAKRPVGLCSTHSAANPVLSIDAPASIAKTCVTGGLLGPAVITPVTGTVVIPTDAVETGGTATDGCSPYSNATAVVGKIVMVDRGLCSFVSKAQVAKAAGAAAVIIGNRDDAPVGFSDPDETLPTTVSIGLTDRESIRTALAAGTPVTVTIKDGSGARFDSYRWLIGEKSEAFGGAIRDMWNPTCYGDPGKVSDVEYKCSTDDNGGVHGNSGVINHGYALLVDGGTDNGSTVRGIGLTKAAAIYYRAMSSYMTPVSDFPDHADALDSACRDLTGQALKELRTDANDSQTSRDRITADDCAQIDLMAAAVELRKDPVQCDFMPQLDPATPSACGAGFTTRADFTEDFEKGIGAWALGGTTVYPQGVDRDWVTTTELPQDNLPAGDQTAAFGPAPDGVGECVGASEPGDFSSVNTLTSPEITVSGDTAPRLVFDHNVGTELGYDGGTVEISVNGGAFTVVPASAYLFNAPSVLSTDEEGNTNPLAGQPGFTGTDGGEIESDWGTSQVDLTKVGVTNGDKIKVQFAIGRDGCGGVDGWWVDNVQVVTCVVGTTPPTPTPTPTSTPTSTPTATPTPTTTPVAASIKVNAPGSVAKGRTFEAKVKVRATAKATGTIQVRFKGKVVGTGTLQDGKVVLRISTKKLKVGGKRSFTVVYGGSAAVAAGSTTFKVRILPRQ